IRHFTPSWFAVTMGTGVLPVVFHQLPYGLSQHLFWPCIALLGLNTLLLLCFSAATILRYILFPGIFKLMLLHPQQSLFLGAIPMGFATAINAATSLLVETKGWGGEALLDFLWGMYWFDLLLSAIVCLLIPSRSTKHPITLDGITATILLPFVPPIVAAALGSQLGTALAETHPGRAQLTLLVSYASLGLGLPIAMLMLCAYTVRILLHGAPPRGALTSVILPLGPLGQGGLAFVSLGELAQKILTAQNLETATIPTNSIFGVSMMGDIAFVYGVLTACVMWGFGMLWLGLALQTLAEALLRKQGPRFGMPWWGLTFPFGVYILLTLSLSVALAPTPISYFLQALGTALAGVLFLLWLYVAARTLVLGIEGSMFDAPCLQTLE
ncbi:C4-dicarboxylate transporter/malic acid transport protein, partial [Calocera viscosa TUFC12733]